MPSSSGPRWRMLLSMRSSTSAPTGSPMPYGYTPQIPHMKRPRVLLSRLNLRVLRVLRGRLDRRRRRERAGIVDGATVDSQGLSRHYGWSTFRVELPPAIEPHPHPQGLVAKEAHDCVRKRSHVTWRDEVSRSPTIDNLGESSDCRRDHRLHE